MKDDWLHSRMALLRGVENGFPLVRVARQGRLTISDAHGRILAEASTARGQAAALLGRVPLKTAATPYTRLGDWFGWANLALALVGGYFLRKNGSDEAPPVLRLARHGRRLNRL